MVKQSSEPSPVDDRIEQTPLGGWEEKWTAEGVDGGFIRGPDEPVLTNCWLSQWVLRVLL